MASVHAIAPQSFLSIPKPKSKPSISHQKPISTPHFQSPKQPQNPIFSRNKRKITWVVNSVVEEEYDVIPVQSLDSTDQQEGMAVSRVGGGGVESELASQVGGFGASEGRFSFEGGAEFQGFGSGSGVGEEIERRESGEIERLIDRTINGTIVLAAGTYAITRLLTIDQDYWHGWTLYEILRYALQHNWSAYGEALKTNPVLAKMVISGMVYSVGDWIAQEKSCWFYFARFPLSLLLSILRGGVETLAICSSYYLRCSPCRTKASMSGLCGANLGHYALNSEARISDAPVEANSGASNTNSQE